MSLEVQQLATEKENSVRNRVVISRRLTFAVLTIGVLAFLSFFVVACTTTSAASPQAAGSQSASQKLTQKSDGGSVTIGATWQNPQEAEGRVLFSIVMDTHSGNLDGYDLGRLASLRNDKGQEVKAERWESPPGGHHREGTLAFPSKDSSGNPILGAKALEMVIRDVAGVKERVLRWEIS